MGGELVENQPPVTYSEYFREVCSWYMSIGMTYDEFWEGDALLPKYYREAYEYKRTQLNHDMWVQGYYIHEAVAVVVYNATRKKGTQEQQYPEKPHPLTKLEKEHEKQCEKQRQEMIEKKNREKAKAIFSAWAEKFKPKKGDSK